MAETEPSLDTKLEDNLEDDEEVIFASKKRKPKSKPKAKEEQNEAPSRAAEISNVSFSNNEADYSYEELIKRIYNLHNAETTQAKDTKIQIPVPLLGRIGTKKTAWTNFAFTCSSINREVEHVKSFFVVELGAVCNVDKDNNLIITGRFQAAQLEKVIRQYIRQYVICPNCKSASTLLKKENRLTFLYCDSDGSRHSVQPITSGFVAANRATRRKEKERQ